MRRVENNDFVVSARSNKDNPVVSAADRPISEAAIHALIGSLHDDDDQIRMAAANSLTQIGEPGIENVIEVLSSEDQIACSLAAQILGVLRAKSAVPELSHLIQDKNSAQHTRLNAIRAIGNIFADPDGVTGSVIQLPGAGGGFSSTIIECQQSKGFGTSVADRTGDTEDPMRPGIKLEQDLVGSGREASRGNSVTIRYVIYLNRGDEVDSRQHTFTIGDREVIAGLEYAVEGMREGGKRRIRVSPHLAYRDGGVPDRIPPNAVLVFEVELIKVITNV